MLIIGLTGGIGSGKSTVAKMFAEHGVSIVDSDLIARNVTKPGLPALNKIIEEFGPDLLKPDGTLDRGALRKIIFHDETKRAWLETLLHPLIRAEIARQVKLATSPYCIVVIPLLFETEANPIIDRILVVDSSKEDQIKRTLSRDNTSYVDVEAIIQTQVNRAKRLTEAHDVIHNLGSLADLKSEVDRFHGFYSIIAQKETIK